jgi:hypothetical protein
MLLNARLMLPSETIPYLLLGVLLTEFYEMSALALVSTFPLTSLLQSQLHRYAFLFFSPPKSFDVHCLLHSILKVDHLIVLALPLLQLRNLIHEL